MTTKKNPNEKPNPKEKAARDQQINIAATEDEINLIEQIRGKRKRSDFVLAAVQLAKQLGTVEPERLLVVPDSIADGYRFAAAERSTTPHEVLGDALDALRKRLPELEKENARLRAQKEDHLKVRATLENRLEGVRSLARLRGKSEDAMVSELVKIGGEITDSERTVILGRIAEREKQIEKEVAAEVGFMRSVLDRLDAILAAAGTALFDGMRVTDKDRPEEVKKRFARMDRLAEMIAGSTPPNASESDFVYRYRLWAIVLAAAEHPDGARIRKLIVDYVGRLRDKIDLTGTSDDRAH